MHRLLHDIRWFLILFMKQLFFKHNQMLNIGSLGKRAKDISFIVADSILGCFRVLLLFSSLDFTQGVTQCTWQHIFTGLSGM